ncbi:kinase-like domain-containing protein [Delphinella strobiligena]|nr:kinase-like domain-containing protein [Delphinella strobiligena]
MQSSYAFCHLRPLSTTASKALDFVENSPFVVCLPASAPPNPRSRENTPIVEEESRAFALTFRTSDLRDPTLGHVFGSNVDRCDVLMDRVKDRGVSGAHFRMQLDYRRGLPDTLYIGNLSRNWTRIADKTLNGPLVHILKNGGTPISILAGRVNLEVTFSTLDMRDRKFLESWEHFRQSALAALPSISNIQLKPIANPTPDVGHIAFAARNEIRCHSGKTYRFAQQIGEGVTGRVYQCVRLSDQEQMAAKVVQRAMNANDHDLFHELNALKRFHHSNLVQYQDFTMVHDSLWIILELATYGDLKQHMHSDRGWPEQDTKELSRQILSGLRYLHHEQHTVHRDVKPANVLVFSVHPAIYKLADFGTAKEISDPYLLTSTFVGTAGYMAPEVWPTSTADGLYDFLADIWSLGTIIWELLTTHHPISFPRWTLYNQNPLQQRVYAGEEIRSWIPKEDALEHRISQSGVILILDMLSLDAATRPAADECLGYEWFQENYIIRDLECDEQTVLGDTIPGSPGVKERVTMRDE